MSWADAICVCEKSKRDATIDDVVRIADRLDIEVSFGWSSSSSIRLGIVSIVDLSSILSSPC